MMKIASVNAFLRKLPLSKPYTIAYKTIEDTEIVFLEIRLENGLSGLGAANPFEEVVGETPADTLRHLQSGALDAWVGRDIRHFNQLIDESRLLFPNLPGAQAAVDIALHDLFCKQLGIPVVEFYGKKMEALPTSVTIGIKPSDEMLEEAAGYFQLGFKALKVKTGLDVAADIERVNYLRERFGPHFQLRVDANQGYDLLQLRQFIQQTRHLNIELIEQPLPACNDTELLDLPDEDRRFLCADESIHAAHSALNLAAHPQPYGIFNIKLMKSGGIKGAKAIAGIAEEAGIDLFWGCNDESIVSITAALHAAFSCPNTRYLDLDGSFDVCKDLVEGGFELKDGLMRSLGLPGLGCSLMAD